LRPKLTRLLSANTNDAERFEVVPAERFTDPCELATVAVAVTTDPFNPNDTLFELLSVNALRLFDVVPALRLMLLIVAAFESIAVVIHAGCCHQIVLGPPACVLWLSVIDCDPAKTQSMPVLMPVLPAVWPVLLTPSPLMALWFVCAGFPLSRIYCVAPLTLDPIVMFAWFEKLTVPDV